MNTSWLEEFNHIKQQILIKCKEEIEMKKEAVNHPAHYTQGNVETIEIIKAMGCAEAFCQGNIVKYITRYRYKGGLEDLKKAQWYLGYLIKMQEEQEKNKEQPEEIWNKAEII